MKYLMIIAFSLFASLFVSDGDDADYDKLWKEVESQENSLPKTAYDLVVKIYQLAKEEGQEDQLIKAILYKTKLTQKFEDKDPAAFILEMEEEQSQLRSSAASAVYASILGEMYSNYGLANAYRFQNRTELARTDVELPFRSLEEIQQKAYNYYIQSLTYAGTASIQDIELLTVGTNNSLTQISATTIEQFLHFRAIQHFINSSNSVALPSNSYLLNTEDLFDSTYKLDLESSTYNDHNYNALVTFQKTKELSGLSSEQQIWIELSRLEFLKQRATVANKDRLYESSMTKLARSNNATKGHEAAYCVMIAKYLNEGNRNQTQLNKKEKTGYTKAAELLAEIEASGYHKDYKQYIDGYRLRLTNKEIKVQTELVNLVNKPFLVKLDYRNLSSVQYQISSLSDKDFDSYSAVYQSEKKINFAKKLAVIQSNSFTLEAGKDHNWHSVELPMQALPPGRYVVLVQDPDDTKHGSLAVFHVSNLAYISAHNQWASDTEIYVVDRDSGKPLAGVKVEAYVQEYNRNTRSREQLKKAESLSDEKGKVLISVAGTNRFTYRLSYKSDLLDLRETHFRNRIYKTEPYKEIHLFSDRAIYRPGQLVHVKGLVLNKDGQHYPSLSDDTKVKLVFRDANWQELSSTSVVTNKYGTFSEVLSVPQDGLTGQFQIEVQCGDYSSNKSIRVEEYKRPKLYSKVDDIQEAYVLGDSVTIGGQLNNFSGSVVTEGKLSYRVEKSPIFRPWYRFCGYFPPSRKSELVASGEVRISNGQFSITFPTKEASNKYASFSYVISMDMSDGTGASISASKTVTLSSSPFSLEVALPEYSFLSDLTPMKVMVANAAKQGVDSEIEIKVYEVQPPEKFYNERYWAHPEFSLLSTEAFRERFPNYAADVTTSELTNWEVGKEIYTATKSGTEIAFDEITQLTQGSYKILINATDNQGNTQEQIRYLSVSDDTGPAFPTQALWVSKLADNYKPGETMDLMVATPYEKADVLYVLRDRSGVKKSDWLTLPSDGKISYTIEEKDRGGLSINFALVKNNRTYSVSLPIAVAWTNKKLNIAYHTFRDKIEPGIEEEWKLLITDEDGQAVSGELLAAMYDASLDQILPENWRKNFFPLMAPQAYTFQGKGFSAVSAMTFAKRLQYKNFYVNGFAPRMNLFGLRIGRGGLEMRSMDNMAESAPRGRTMSKGIPVPASVPREPTLEADAVHLADKNSYNEQLSSEDNTALQQQDPDQISIRENLKETVFFYPHLEIENGEAIIKFTMNEALTKWKLMLFAHNQDLEYAFDEKEIVTQKPLMIEPHLPRFVRQGDQITVNAKVTNFSESPLDLTAYLDLIDAISGKELSSLVTSSSESFVPQLGVGESKIVEWQLKVPEEVSSPITIKMWTKGGNHTDGEQNVLPVLSNRMLVTETLPFHIGSESTQVFDFEEMSRMSSSETLINHSYSIEFTSNPAWTVVKAIPYLTVKENPSTIELANALYGNLLMRDIITKNPDIRKAIELWKEDDLTSPLNKNKDLKLSLITDTPWVRDALEEESNRALLKLYLDDNYITNQIQLLTKKLSQRQYASGGLSWMPEGRDNWYVTQNVLERMGHLAKLGIAHGMDDKFLEKSLNYMDARFAEHDKKIKEKDRKLYSMAIHYLYVRSMYLEVKPTRATQKLIDKYLGYAEKQWTEFNTYQQALLALGSNRLDKKHITGDIYSSLKEKMIVHSELGNYWNDQAGYYWYNNSIEKQAIMIELYDELGADQETIDGLKLWLLKNKQTNNWRSSKATASACYAFMLNRVPVISDSEELDIRLPLAGEQVRPQQKDLGTGYFRKDWNSNSISEELKTVEVSNPNKHVVWGAAYWQYYEELDKIESTSETPLAIRKETYKVSVNNTGEVLDEISAANPVVPGDRLRIRIEIQVDRPMEYVELKDLRSSSLEPVNVLSSYKYQDGLSYYESTKDVASYFYFDFLPKGNWVFEYDVKAAHVGEFSNGIAQIQSIYAPEFSSHNNGQRLGVTKS